MTTLKRRRALNKKLIDFINDFGDSMSSASDKLKEKAIKKTISVNKSKKPLTASSLVRTSINKDLQKIINDTNATYEDFIKGLERYFVEGYELKLTKKDIESISTKLSTSIDSLTDNTAILSRDIKAILTQNLGNGIDQERLVLELQDLYPAYSRNASTIINTGLSRIYVDANIAKLSKLGFDWYLYAGPDDSITREKPCKHWVNHRFTASELDTVTATRLQLWNCRHNIIPLSESEIDQYPILDTSFAA